MADAEDTVREMATMLGYENIPADVVRVVHQSLTNDYLDNLCDTVSNTTVSEVKHEQK